MSEEKSDKNAAPDLVPDSFEPIVAMRAWRVSPNRMGLRALRSTGVDEAWHPGVNRARCRYSANGADISFMFWGVEKSLAPRGHPVPHKDCVCGFWALSDPLLLAAKDFKNGDHVPIVYGVVELWGRVICGSEGWRGEYARLTALIQRDRNVRRVERQISAGYLVPLLAQYPALTPPLSGGES